MTQPNSFDQFFEGGAKSISFDERNDQRAKMPRGGRITAITEPTQQTKMDSGEPLYWDPPHNTRPKMQVVITLDTTAGSCPERVSQDDDGMRSLYAKGGVQQAISQALKDAGAKIQVGGMLYVVWVGVEPAKRAGFNDRKIYKAKYEPPVASAATGTFFGAQAAPDPVLGQAPPPQAQQFGQPQWQPGGQQQQQFAPAAAPAAPAQQFGQPTFNPAAAPAAPAQQWPTQMPAQQSFTPPAADWSTANRPLDGQQQQQFAPAAAPAQQFVQQPPAYNPQVAPNQAQWQPGSPAQGGPVDPFATG